jgi:glycosyltransferase involved in cell wall biosynthesis
MIVKDEAPIIEKTLQHLCDTLDISYWVICDTGSTDGTQQIIIDFFNRLGINGKLYEDQWKDFGHNRTLAIKRAQGTADYILVFDADDSIEGELILPQDLSHEQYMLYFSEKSFVRPLLLRGNVDWKWLGVLHEFIVKEDDSTPSSLVIEGNYWVNSGRYGNRSNVHPHVKYLNDAKVLEQAYWDDLLSGGSLYPRYCFYTAQSYKDCEHRHQAIEYYLKTIDTHAWNEERYCSALYAGILYFEIDEAEKAIQILLHGQSILGTRCECYFEIAKYYNSQREWELAFKYLIMASKISKPNTGLFIDNSIYDWRINFELHICAYYVNELEIGKKACLDVINCGHNTGVLDLCKNNLKYYE